MSHANYRVSPAMRVQWLWRMTQALAKLVTDADLRVRLIEEFAQTANHLINTGDSHTSAA